MTGKLSANYGFEAGIGNTRILETYSQDITDPEGVVTAIEYGIRITGNLKVGGDSCISAAGSCSVTTRTRPPLQSTLPI